MGKKEKIIGTVIVLCIAVTTGIFVMGFREANEFADINAVEMFKNTDDIKEDISNENNKSNDKNKETEEKEEKNEIVVEIKGEVLKPDVYSLNLDSRVNELIEKAGGLTEKADINGINRASLLSDGECIVIKNIDNKESEEEGADLNSDLGVNNNTSGSAQNKDGIININTATVDDFKTLNGIGDSKASAIIDYREQIGKFKSVDEIKNVTGIGEKTLEKIKDKLKV